MSLVEVEHGMARFPFSNLPRAMTRCRPAADFFHQSKEQVGLIKLSVLRRRIAEPLLAHADHIEHGGIIKAYSEGGPLS